MTASIPDNKTDLNDSTPVDYLLWYLILVCGDRVWKEIKEDWKRLAKKYTKQIKWEDYVEGYLAIPAIEKMTKRLCAARMHAYVEKRVEKETE